MKDSLLEGRGQCYSRRTSKGGRKVGSFVERTGFFFGSSFLSLARVQCLSSSPVILSRTACRDDEAQAPVGPGPAFPGPLGSQAFRRSAVAPARWRRLRLHRGGQRARRRRARGQPRQGRLLGAAARGRRRQPQHGLRPVLARSDVGLLRQALPRGRPKGQPVQPPDVAHARRQLLGRPERRARGLQAAGRLLPARCHARRLVHDQCHGLVAAERQRLGLPRRGDGR